MPDCLSRAVTSNAEQIQPLDVGHVVEDEWIAAMIKKITDNPLRYPNYQTRDGHVFKKVTCRDGNKDRRKDILRRYHDDATTGGHLGVYTTHNKISNNHTWPRMKADVCRYIRRCPVCASVKPEQKYPVGTMGSRPEISRPWRMISADLFGLLPRNTSGHECVPVITDYFSKFNIFVSVRSPTTRKVIDEIEQRVFLMFGVPEFVIVDNGVQFGRSHEFPDFLRRYEVEPYYNS
jgi:hypothetical protein